MEYCEYCHAERPIGHNIHITDEIAEIARKSLETKYGKVSNEMLFNG